MSRPACRGRGLPRRGVRTLVQRHVGHCLRSRDQRSQDPFLEVIDADHPFPERTPCDIPIKASTLPPIATNEDESQVAIVFGQQLEGGDEPAEVLARSKVPTERTTAMIRSRPWRANPGRGHWLRL